jgi:AbrB family looped-hinge helix DNA binding protein
MPKTLVRTLGTTRCSDLALSIYCALYASVIDKESVMTTVTISPKFQVVIPKSIRESMHLHPGQKVQAIQFDDRIELVPVLPMDQVRGFLRGIDTSVPREDDRS